MQLAKAPIPPPQGEVPQTSSTPPIEHTRANASNLLSKTPEDTIVDFISMARSREQKETQGELFELNEADYISLQNQAKSSFGEVFSRLPRFHLGTGSEGVAYKIEFSTSTGIQTYLCIKKRHDGEFFGIQNEYAMQEIAHTRALSSHGISVPKPYFIAAAEGNDYLLMDYVPGKTLYGLQLEILVNQLLLDELIGLFNSSISPDFVFKVMGYIQEITMNSKPLTSSGTGLLADYYAEHAKRCPIQFQTDHEGEEVVIQILEFIAEIRGQEHDPRVRTKNAFGADVLSVVEKKYKASEKKNPLFTPELGQKIHLSLRSFFTELHSKDDVYHRDFHPRNIIFGTDGNTHVIDFGYAKISNNSDPYGTPGSDAVRIDDMNLVQYIRGFTQENKPIGRYQLLLEQSKYVNQDFTKLRTISGLTIEEIRLKLMTETLGLPNQALATQIYGMPGHKTITERTPNFSGAKHGKPNLAHPRNKSAYTWWYLRLLVHGENASRGLLEYMKAQALEWSILDKSARAKYIRFVGQILADIYPESSLSNDFEDFTKELLTQASLNILSPKQES